MTKSILSGNEAVATGLKLAQADAGVGYPGTPSTEILENFALQGGAAYWAPNEKVALEEAAGVSYAGGRVMVTMKHVGLNVAADPLFTLAYTGTKGGLVIVSADDPGMASSQNEQDNRNYAKFVGIPMLEPSDSAEAVTFTKQAFLLSEQVELPVLLRFTTRVSHTKSIVDVDNETPLTPFNFDFVKAPKERVMVPANAKKAHIVLEGKLDKLKILTEASPLNYEIIKDKNIGIITGGACFMHVQEAFPNASILKLGFTWPLPLHKIKAFADKVQKCFVIEEGSRFLEENIKAAGINITGKADGFLFGELNVDKVRKIINGQNFTYELKPLPHPPALCLGCPHRKTFEILHDLDCIVAGDIGCYSLGVMPPFNAMDFCLCMGAGIGIGVGLRRILPEDKARKVVSIIGDSTFLHSGITGLIEMVYNKPATGHVVIVMDNSTTAMTGLQEHAATGRKMNLAPARKHIEIADFCKAAGVDNVDIIDPNDAQEYKELLLKRLASDDTSVIISRRSCVLELKKLAKLGKGKG